MSDIDVIIPAYNEEKTIRDCLTALSNQAYTGSYRIIVVDNSSTDATKKIAESYPNVLVKSEKQKGYVFAVKAGIEKYSTAPIIAQTDADTVVDTHWLSEISKAFTRNSDVVASGGPFYFKDGPLLFRVFVNSANYTIPILLNSHLCGMNMAYKRTAYDAVGGYDPNINIGADTLLGIKLKKYGKILLLRNQFVYGSARRYNSIGAIVREVPEQLGNYFSLLFRSKPTLYNATDYRS